MAHPLDELGDRIGRLRLDDVPTSTRRHASWVIADTIGVCLAGGRLRELQSHVAASEAPADGTATAQCVTPGLPWRGVHTAALVNASAAVALELDESRPHGGHPAAFVVPVALAVAQQFRRSGADLLLAVIAGYEVAARLHAAYPVTYPMHPHGGLDAVGAATAAALLTRGEPRRAMSVAASAPTTMGWASCFAGSQARNTGVGVAAVAAMLGAELAAAGVDGTPGILDEIYSEVGGTPGDTSVLAADVDPSNLAVGTSRFRTVGVASPLVPAMHATADLGPVDVGGLERVHVDVPARAMKYGRMPEPNDLSSRFSLPYAVAATLIHGLNGLMVMTYEDHVAELAGIVRVRQDPALRDGSAVVTLIGAGGRSVGSSSGSLSSPPTELELRAKFVACVPGPSADQILDRLLCLEEVDDCRDLLEVGA